MLASGQQNHAATQAQEILKKFDDIADKIKVSKILLTFNEFIVLSLKEVSCSCKHIFLTKEALIKSRYFSNRIFIPHKCFCHYIPYHKNNNPIYDCINKKLEDDLTLLSTILIYSSNS